MATCLDNILCENAFGCDITVLDSEGNPVDPLKLNNGDSVIFVLGEKPGYRFLGWTDENGLPYFCEPLGDNRYRFRNIDCSKQYIAKYCAIRYTISVTSNDFTCFEPSNIQAHYGAIVTIQAPDSLKCRFMYWTKDDEIYSENNSFEYVVTGNASFVANYDRIKYRITAKPDRRNRGICEGSGVYELNTDIQISANPNNGYTFDGWDDGITQNPRSVTVRGNKTYTAIFGVQDNIIYVPSVSGGSVIGSGTYRTGNPVSLQALPEAGWKFSHWIVGGERITGETLNFVADRDVTVIPYFTKGAYSIIFKASPFGKGYFVPASNVLYSYGDIVEVEAFPNIGYVFSGWTDGFSQPKRNITVYGNTEYVAVFKPEEEKYTLSVLLPDASYACSIYIGYKSIGMRENNGISTSVVAGTSVKLAPVVPDGKRLVSVTDGNGETVWVPDNSSDNTSVLIPYTVGNEDVELTLNFADLVYSVTVTMLPLNDDTSGNAQLAVSIGSVYDMFSPSVSNPSRKYDGITFGTVARVVAPSFVGTHAFSYWYTDNGSFTTPTMYTTVDKNLNCTAVYE